MGQEKNRGSQFEIAYDAVFDIVKEVYRQTGCINHQLMGLEFKLGEIVRINSLPIDAENINRLPENLQLMLAKWPVVVDVFEAWSGPAGEGPASKHPNRKDIVAIMIHGAEVASSASCEVDMVTKEVKKGPLVSVEKIEGRFGRPLAVKH